jgi:hypothetical protein
MDEVLLSRPYQRTAMEHPAIEAEDTLHPALRTLDLLNRWSRILSINCGFE